LRGMKPKVTLVPVCRICGTANHRDERKCERCGCSDWKADSVSLSAVTADEASDPLHLKSSSATTRQGPTLLWAGLLLLWVPISLVLAIAVGEVWAGFVDKPGTRPEQSIRVLVVPWVLLPGISGLYLLALAVFYIYRAAHHKR
jgi:hypothetical protein